MIENLGKESIQQQTEDNNIEGFREKVKEAEKGLAEAVQKLEGAKNKFAQDTGITEEEKTKKWGEISKYFDNINETLKVYGAVGIAFPSLVGMMAPYAVDAYIQYADKFEVVDYSWFAERGIAVSAAATALYGIARVWSHFARKKAQTDLLNIPTKK